MKDKEQEKSKGIDNKGSKPNKEEIWSDFNTMMEMLYPFFRIKIAMLGNLSNRANCRGITCLSIPARVLNRIILNRIKELVSTQLQEQHIGFHRAVLH